MPAETGWQRLLGLLSLKAWFWLFIVSWWAMLVALALYVRVALRSRETWAWLMVLGITLNIVAAAIQATGSIRIDVGVPLDHNGVFHLVQMVALVVLVAGIGGSLTRGADPAVPNAME